MNHKEPFISDGPTPIYQYHIVVNGYWLHKGMLISVHRRPGLIGGKWEFVYAERLADGTVLIHIEGPLRHERRHKVIREADIKTVHVKSEPRP